MATWVYAVVLVYRISGGPFEYEDCLIIWQDVERGVVLECIQVVWVGGTWVHIKRREQWVAREKTSLGSGKYSLQ